jgi:hypothetical protein
VDRLYGGEGIVQVILVTGLLGSGAAWLSGRAIAGSWQPQWQVALAALFLGAAARFLHFALFQGAFLSFRSYCVDALIFLIVGLMAWWVTRATQMVRQYPWLYVRSGPFGWREIGQENAGRKW